MVLRRNRACRLRREARRKEIFGAELAQAYIETAEDLRQFAEESLSLAADVVMKYAPYDESEERA